MCAIPRRAAVVLVGIHLLAVFGAYHHLATASHAYCSDHGQLVHAELSAGQPAPGARPVVEPRRRLRGVHGCLQLEFLVQLAASLGIAPLGVVSIGDGMDHVARSSPLVAPSIPLLLQSPKLSPPAV